MADPDTYRSLFNVEAEAALLGALLIESSIIDSIASKLAVDDFSEPAHGQIYEIICREHALGKRVTPITLKGFMEGWPSLEALGGSAYLARLTASGDGMLAPRQLAEQIAELAVRRKIHAGLMQAAADCADLSMSVPAIASAADGVIQAANDASESRVISLGDAAASFMRAMDEPDVGIVSQLVEPLDETLGKLRPGRMYIVAGRPGMAKTTVALTYGRGVAAQGIGVQMFQYEMAAEDMASKAISEVSFDAGDENRVPHKALENRNPTRQQLSGMIRAANALQGLPFEIVDDVSVTIARMAGLVRSCKRRMAARGTPLGLVIVDYLQLVSPDQRHQSKVTEISEISIGLKRIARREGVAVLALAQLSRAVEQRADKRPMLSDLRESGQIEQDADSICFLLREEYYLRQAEPEPFSDDRADWEAKLNRVAGVIEFIGAKKRFGQPGSSFGRFMGAYSAVR